MVGIPTRSKFGIEMIAIMRIPEGYSLLTTNRGSNISTNAYFGGDKLLLDATTPIRKFQWLDHTYIIGGDAIWESASLDDDVKGTMCAPPSEGITVAAGDYQAVDTGAGGNIIVPVDAGTGNRNIADLNAKRGSTKILKVTPVPNTSNAGKFYYDEDENTIEVASESDGNVDLFDFEIPLFVGCYCHGKKQDGAITRLNTEEVVGKIFWNTWQIQFELTVVTPNCRVGLELGLGVPKDV
jgi:hypothetical protein